MTNSSPNPWQLKSTRIAYQNPWMTIREDSVVTPTGKDGIYGYLESNDSVMVVATNAAREIFMVKTFRYPQKTWNWELPGGGGDKEDPLKASKRELEEESGLLSDHWTELGSTAVCNGFMTEQMTSLLAESVTGAGIKQPDEQAIADSGFFSLETIDGMVDRGEVNDGQTLAALYLYKRYLDRQHITGDSLIH